MSDVEPTAGPGIARLGPTIGSLGIGGLASYLGIALLFRQRILGLRIGLLAAGVGLLLFWMLLVRTTRSATVQRRVGPARLLELGLAGLAIVVALLAVDLVYGVNRARAVARVNATIAPELRQRDPHVWHGELMPRSFVPSDGNFVLYKPNARLSAETYGDFYNPTMQGSPTVGD